jgi:prolyl-tRNA editing enzyme YbaK/EbsC (Cys-tRNA(Pro) deacylase)
MTSDPVERVQAALDALDLGIQVQRFEVPTATAAQAADAIGCELGAIVKSLCFLVDANQKPGWQPVLVLAAGDRRVDPKALRRLFQVSKKKVKIADPEAVLAATGFPVGGVPPLGHPAPLLTLIDESLGRFETVYAAAGSDDTIFPIAYETLVQVTGSEVRALTS